MMELPYKTEILDWNEDVVTVKISGVRGPFVKKRAQKISSKLFEMDVEVIDTMKAEYSEGLIKSYIVTFRRLDTI